LESMFTRWLPVALVLWVVAAVGMLVASGCLPANVPVSTQDGGADAADPATCILETVTADILSGMTPAQAFIDAAGKCLVDVAYVERLWNAHHASMKRLEKFDAGGR
jgi:hypothetical protein